MHPRQAKFLTLPQYQDDSGKPLKRWVEECESVYITSARLKQEWFWNTFKKTVTNCFMNKHEVYNFFAGDIFLSIEFGLKTVSDYFKAKANSSDLDFRTEDLNEMIGEAEDAFFKYDLIKKNQVCERAFKFPTTQNIMIGDKLNNRQKEKDEIRLLWIDFAFANTVKEENDQSVIGCMSLVKRDGKYKRIVDYITTHPSGDSDGIDLKIREMFWDYQADYIVYDCRNGGETLYNDMTKPRYHSERGQFWNFHGFTVAIDNDYQIVSPQKIEDLRNRTIDSQAVPCMIPIIGTAEFNSNMWMELQKALRDETIDLLIDDIEFENLYTEIKEYYELSDEERRKFKLPYVMTMALVNEAINLSQEWKEGKVKLTEPRSGTKDIIVALAYGNYIASLIINKLEKNNDTENEFDINDWSFLSN